MGEDTNYIGLHPKMDQAGSRVEQGRSEQTLFDLLLNLLPFL